MWAWVLTIFIGLFAVLQSGLNRNLGRDWDLSSAILLNNAVLLGLGIALFVASRFVPAWLAEEFRPRAGARFAFAPWQLLPGIMGFGVVALLPFVFGRLGGSKAFITLISAQVLVSLAWDFSVEGLRPGALRIAGALLALVGAALSAL
jgi:uncharacterized membrane protein YdcZ (DUF606 family)